MNSVQVMPVIAILLQDVNSNLPLFLQRTDKSYPIKEMLTSLVNRIIEGKIIFSIMVTTVLLGMSLIFRQETVLFMTMKT